jgi:uncharacterized protein
MRVSKTSLTILLPPSEGKATDGTATSGTGSPTTAPGWSPELGVFGAALGDRRIAVVEALLACDGGDAKLLGVTGKHLDRAQGANRTLLGAPTMPAWQRYTGVVWEHLAVTSLTAPQRRSIVVVSGLLGLVRGDDPLPDYRLKMGATLPPLGKLARWWSEPITHALEAASRRRFVIDLLPAEHRAALVPGLAGTRLAGVSVTLRERSGASGGHAAKAAKGRLAHHLVTHAGEPTEALASWTDERFVLDIDDLS